MADPFYSTEDSVFNNTQTPTTPPPASTGGGGGFGDFSWLTDVAKTGSNMFSGMNPMAMAQLIPALAQAYKHYNDAGKYQDTAKTASTMTAPSQIKYDPVVGQGTRQKYQDRLDQYYTDPTAFLLSNPEYMATQKLGLNALNARNASRGHFGGDGKATTDELEYISTLGSRFLDKERDDLFNLGGFQFDPANNLNAATSANVAANNANKSSADFLMRGNEQEITAKNDAMKALFSPFGSMFGPSNTTTNTNTGGGGPGGGGPGSGGGGTGWPGLGNVPPGIIPKGTPPAIAAAAQAAMARGIPFQIGSDGSLRNPTDGTPIMDDNGNFMPSLTNQYVQDYDENGNWIGQSPEPPVGVDPIQWDQWWGGYEDSGYDLGSWGTVEDVTSWWGD